MTLYDAHCHLDFATTPASLAAGLASMDVRVASATVTPSGYRKALQVLGGFDHVRVGLGLHPWWIADGRLSLRDVQDFQALVQNGARFISELGLDFGPKCLESSVRKGLASSHEEAKALQLEAFRDALSSCAGRGLFVSLHSVKAEEQVLDVLDSTGAIGTSTCVFHGFNGPHDQLLRALDKGCYVSIGPRMLSSKRGRAYAKAIPAERILLETDAPSSEGMAMDAATMHAKLVQCLDALMDARGLDGDARKDFAFQVEKTSSELLGFAAR